MRFITEFESLYDGMNHPKHSKVIKDYEGRGQMDIGNMIAQSFGWKQNERRFNVLHSLEIEAFPMDKWIEFKNKLFTYLSDTDGMVSGTRILQMVKDLESFGKPAGATKEMNDGQ
jgi:hypothetical protein